MSGLQSTHWATPLVCRHNTAQVVGAQVPVLVAQVRRSVVLVHSAAELALHSVHARTTELHTGVLPVQPSSTHAPSTQWRQVVLSEQVASDALLHGVQLPR